jgi:hypothetical protein
MYGALCSLHVATHASILLVITHISENREKLRQLVVRRM